jgi:hypothetical protein
MNANTINVMESVELYIKTNGKSPSLLDLMTLTGLKSTAAVNYHLTTLISEGYLRRDKDKYKQRALAVVRGSDEITIPTPPVVREPNGRASRREKVKKQASPKIDIEEMKRIKARRDAIRLKRLHDEARRRRDGLGDRIEMVVAQAKQRETTSGKGDVFLNSSALFPNRRVRGSKVG